MGNNNDVPGVAMMNYFQDFPYLTYLMDCLVDIGLTEEELTQLVKRQIEHSPELRQEIIRSFEDSDFSWGEILNHQEIGEVHETESEEEARAFAVLIFLKSALA